MARPPSSRSVLAARSSLQSAGSAPAASASPRNLPPHTVMPFPLRSNTWRMRPAADAPLPWLRARTIARAPRSPTRHQANFKTLRRGHAPFARSAARLFPPWSSSRHPINSSRHRKRRRSTSKAPELRLLRRLLRLEALVLGLCVSDAASPARQSIKGVAACWRSFGMTRGI